MLVYQRVYNYNNIFPQASPASAATRFPRAADPPPWPPPAPPGWRRRGRAGSGPPRRTDAWGHHGGEPKQGWNLGKLVGKRRKKEDDGPKYDG